MTKPLRLLPALVLILPLLVGEPARAQVESALLSKVSFNLTNPGGKSLAMGGAFTAIADDATAALANPAGLGLLSTIEVGVSGKRFDDVVGLSTARSSAAGGLTAPYPAVRPVASDLSSTLSGVEFAGVVIPLGGRFVAAVTFAENLRFRTDPGPDGYSYVELRDNRSGGTTRRDFLFEYREYGAVALTNRLAGVSLGYRVFERLRLGAGLTLNRTTFSLEGDAGGPHRIVSRAFLTPTQVETLAVSMATENFGGTAPGLVLGLHADLLASGKLTVGAAYRVTKGTTGALVIGGDVPAALQSATRRELSFTVPSDLSLGLAWQPIPGLTVAAEGQWIRYGQAFGESLPVVSYRGLVGPSPGVPVEDVLVTLSPADDVLVPRLGFEYVATAEDLRIAFRVGYHREPAHGVKADLVVRDASGTPYDITDPPFSPAVRTVFDGGRPDDRFSGGLGATLARSLSFDLSFDVGRSSRRLAASVFYRF